MKNDIPVKNGIVIPGHEIEITASRAGGPGGQHVNKTSTHITLRWNIPKTGALDETQKELVLKKLSSRLTTEGDLIIHSSASRSQQQNKKAALNLLAEQVKKALQKSKKRIPTRVPKSIKEKRLQKKKMRSEIKKTRTPKFNDY